MKQLFFMLIMLCSFVKMEAQLFDTIPEMNPEYFQKKMRWGVAFNQSFSSIIGSDQPLEYFVKPSLGGGLEMEYYFSKNFGLGAGLLFQQRGAGIFNPDVTKEVGDPDSTHRQRLRFNCIDLPLRFCFRLDKGLTKGNRWSGSLGIIPRYSFKTNSVFHSIEDGFHVIEDWGADFNNLDLEISSSFGLSINAGDAALLHVHLYANYGFLNTYSNSGKYSTQVGNHLLFGLRLSALL